MESAKRLLGILLLAFAATGCGGGTSQIVAHRLVAPEGAYLRVQWTSDQTLVVWYETQGYSSAVMGSSVENLWEFRPSSLDIHTLNLDQLPMLDLTSQRCKIIEVPYFEVTPGGQIASLFNCLFGEARPNRPGPPGGEQSNGSVWLGIANHVGGQVKLFRPYEMESSQRTFTLSPDLTTGILATRDPLGNAWAWLEEGGLRPLNIGLARANRPAWSPNGQWIAFFGNKQQASQGVAWASDRFDLMLMPADCRETNDCAKRIEVLAKGFTGAVDQTDYSTLSWSPDSRWLAFGGGDTHPGIWLLNVKTRALRRVVSGQYLDPAWSPDGTKLVFIGPPPGGWPSDPTDSSSSLYTADVSSIVGSSSQDKGPP